MVGLQSACRYKLEFPSRRKVKMLVDGGECAMKNGEPITKSILIADLPAGDKPWSCRPAMPAVCRLRQVSSAMLPQVASNGFESNGFTAWSMQRTMT